MSKKKRRKSTQNSSINSSTSVVEKPENFSWTKLFLFSPWKYLFIFLLVFIVHLIGMNQIGRTWDEQFKVDLGYWAWDRALAGDYRLEVWNHGNEHPMVAKYVYGAFLWPEMIRIDNRQSLAEFSTAELMELESGRYVQSTIGNKLFMIDYDFTAPRILSAIFNSLAVILTVLISTKILKGAWGWLVAGGLILMPRFVALGQLITYESLSNVLFVLTVGVFYKLLKHKHQARWYVLTGLLTGGLFWTRYNNVYVFLFIAGWWVIDWFYSEKKWKEIFNWRVLIIPVSAFLLGVMTWPLVWHDFPNQLINSFRQHETRGIGPSLYFVKMLLITTPIPIVLGLVVGIIKSVKQKTRWQAVLLWWFFSTLIFFSILSVPMGGTRYIFTIYPVVAILSVMGWQWGYEVLRAKFSQHSQNIAVGIATVLVAFMAFDMARVYPYYIDYYSHLVGGIPGAVKLGQDFSWWGEGQKAAGEWLNNNVLPDSEIGLMVTPQYVFPPLRRDLKFAGYINEDTQPQYVVVSYTNWQTLSEVYKNQYDVIHRVEVQQQPLLYILVKKK